MTEMTEKILVALGEIGEEKVQAADTLEKLQHLLEENGVKATQEEIREALAAGADKVAQKRELGEEDLDNVAGGFPPALIPLIIKGAKLAYNIYQVYEIAKTVVETFKDSKGSDGSGQASAKNAAPNTNNQTNSNNSKGGQQNNVNAPNNMTIN